MTAHSLALIATFRKRGRGAPAIFIASSKRTVTSVAAIVGDLDPVIEVDAALLYALAHHGADVDQCELAGGREIAEFSAFLALCDEVVEEMKRKRVTLAEIPTSRLCFTD
jgi:hypothetical protein